MLLFVYAGWVNAGNDAFNQFFSSFDTLSAKFKQHTYDESGVLLSETIGDFLFKRPQQFIWRTQMPNQQTLLLNNNVLWLIDFELEQASLQKPTDLTKTPLYWLINRPVDIKKTPKYGYQKTGLDWYLTEQKNQLRFGFKNDILHTIALNNVLNQQILLTFSMLERNPEIDSKAFKLKLNPAFDIMRPLH